MSWEDELDRPADVIVRESTFHADPVVVDPRDADLAAIAASPLMRPPVMASDALAASIRASRELTRDQRNFKESLIAHRAREQAERSAAQDAHPDAAAEERAGEEADVQTLLERFDRDRKPRERRDPSQLPPMPALSEIQQELLAVAGQEEPPQRALHLRPVEERFAHWIDEYAESSSEEMTDRLRTLHKQYVDSRHLASADARRMWNAQQQLHALSGKLASIRNVGDFATLQTQLAARDAGDPAAAEIVDPAAYFYDLYTLDLDSYADLKHAHSSSVVAQVSAGTGWWRTQIGELEEDLDALRRKDADLLRRAEEDADEDGILDQAADDDDDPFAQHDEDRPRPAAPRDRVVTSFDRLGSGAEVPSTGLLLGRRATSEADLEADLLAADLDASLGGVAASRRLTKAQRLARSQGRSYHSVSTGDEVMLPAGQRILRPGQKAQSDPSQPTSQLMRDMEAALQEGAQGVKKPMRKSTFHD